FTSPNPSQISHLSFGFYTYVVDHTDNDNNSSSNNNKNNKTICFSCFCFNGESRERERERERERDEERWRKISPLEESSDSGSETNGEIFTEWNGERYETILKS
ncbi:hypothetical protein SSS_09532, partial [Sarcoptes scabiei]